MAVLTGGRRNGVAVLTGVVVLMRALLQENVLPAGGQKSNRNNEVTVLPRWP